MGKEQAQTEKITFKNELDKEIRWAETVKKHARVGKYIDIHKMLKTDFTSDLGRLGKWYDPLTEYTPSLERHGKDALAHLCLPYSYLGMLDDEGIETISSLEMSLEQGLLNGVAGFGSKTMERIKAALSEWKEIPDTDTQA